MTLDRAIHAYLFAVRERATDEERDRIDAALEPPSTVRDASGAPAWWGSDEEAWIEARAGATVR